MYAASSDGSLAVFQFDPDELDGIAPHSIQEQYLSKFGFTPPPLPEGYSHVPKEPQMSPRSHSQAQMQTQTQTSGGFASQTNGTGERVNVLVAKRGNKKRPKLTQPNAIPSASTTGASSSMLNGVPKRASLVPMPVEDVVMSAPRSNATFPPPEEQPFGDVDMAPADVLDPFTPGKRKRRASDAADDSRPVYRTLGSRQRETISVRELVSSGENDYVASSSKTLLPLPPLLPRLSADVVGNNEEMLEAYNPEDGSMLRSCLLFNPDILSLTGPSEVVFVVGKQTQWLNYTPSPVVALKATKFFCAAAMQDGTVNVYTKTGRR